MATAKEVFEALVEKAGFKADNEWPKDTFARKDIAPGKVYLYFQTESEEGAKNPNFGFRDEGGLKQREYDNLKIELHNIVGGDPEEFDGGYAFVYANNLEDRTVTWTIKTMQELERCILFELSK